MSRANERWTGARPWIPILARAALVTAAVALTACSSVRGRDRTDAAAPAILATIQAAGVHDLRGSYRSALCRRLPGDGTSCDDVLLRLPGEESSYVARPSEDPARRYRVAFVPGLLADCVGPLIRPFAGVARDLARAGIDVHYLPVAGRGTSAANAERLAREVAALPEDGRPLIVFAYSKGLPDFLEFIRRHPEQAGRIAAIVGIAGAAQGSLLADELQSQYRLLVSSSRLFSCEPGTGEEIDDVRREVRLEWWRQHRARVSVPVFSLVTMPRPDRLTPFTATMYRRLASIDPLNDGLLFWYDQIVPGGHLLGFVNADHWAVVQSVGRGVPIMGILFHDDYVPRTRLVEAAIEVVDNTLRSAAARPREGDVQAP